MALHTDYPVGFQSLILGNTTDLPSQDSNVVRVFLSSTFTDTVHERNRLLKDVFPDLRKHCQRLGLDFEVVDMRWGVRDNATADHLTSALCVKEIETCKRLSMGPHFVGFLGNKYGYQPLPSTIDSAHFAKLFQAIQSQDTDPEECQLLIDWYVQDTNATPPVYVLQPITSLLANFYNAEQPQLQKKERDDWWNIYRRLQRILQRGAQDAVQNGWISKRMASAYFRSVTETELRQSLKGLADPSERCLFFVRNLEGLGVNLEDKATRSYLDLNQDGSINEDAQASLENLKTKYLPSVIGEEALHRYTLPWTPAGLDPAHPAHAQYLDDICSSFKNGLQRLIERQLEQKSKVKDQVVAAVYEEVLHHARFCEAKCSVFHGRQELLISLRDYLSQKPDKPLVVHGSSGSGKTSVMAMLARHAHDWLPLSTVVIVRFLGTSGSTSGIHATLQSVCRQISYAYGLNQPNSVTLDDYTELTKHFRKLLDTVATSDKPLLLIFDSIDQLSAANDAHAMNWLPMSLPPHILIVVSMLSEDQHRCLEKIQLLLPGDGCYTGMQPISQDDGLEILGRWLEAKHRRLTEVQLVQVSEAFAKSPQPLFLKLLFENVLHWKSYIDETAKKPLPMSVREAINNLFQELEHKHGQIVISHALGYISAAKNGITEAEIEDVLSCDDEVLNDVYQYWDPPGEDIVRIPPSLWKRIHYDIGEFLSERQSGGKTVVTWYHRQFMEAAQDCYLSNQESILLRHQLLARMFLGSYSVGMTKPITLHKRNKVYPKADRQVAPQPLEFSPGVYNRRKLLQLSHHLAEAGMLDEFVSHVLCNFNWLLTKLIACSFLELMLDFRPINEEILILIETMYLASSNLKVDPFSLAGQLLGRIGDYGDKYPNLERLLLQTKDWIKNTELPLLVPRIPCLIPPGGPLRTVFGGHPSLVLKVMCTPSKEVMASACLDSDSCPMLNVWNLSTLELIHTLQKKTSESPVNKSSQVNVCITKNSRCVIFGRRSLGVFDLIIGDFLRELDCDGLTSFSNVALDVDDTKVIACAEPDNLVCVWNLATGQRLTSLQHSVKVVFATFLSCKELIFSLCEEGKLRLWSRESYECLSCEDGYGKGKTVTCVALDANENRLISGSSEGEMKIWSLTELSSKSPSVSLILEFSVSVKAPLLDVIFHSSSNVVLRDSSSVARICHLIPENKPQITDLKGHDSFVTCVSAYSGDPEKSIAALLVTGSKDDTLKVWALDDGQCLNTLKGHSSWISDVTMVTIQDGLRVLSACNDKTVKMWIPTKGEVTERERHELSALCVGLYQSSDSSIGVSAAKDKQTKFWNMDTAVCYQSVNCATVDMEVLTEQKIVVCGTESGNVVAFSVETGDEVWCQPLFKKSISVMALAQKQLILISSKDASDRAIRVCDATNEMAEIIRLGGHAETTTILRVVNNHENPMYLSASKMAGAIKAWEVDGGNCLTIMQHDRISSMEVSPNFKYLASGSDKGTIKIWSLGNTSLGSLLTSMDGLYNDTIVCMAFDQESRYIISGAHVPREQCLVWNFQKKETRFLAGHTHAVMSISVTLNNKYVVSSSRDCTIKAWDLKTCSLVASFDCQSQVKFFKYMEVGLDHYRLIATNQSGTIPILDLLLGKAHQGESCEQGTAQIIRSQSLVSEEKVQNAGDGNASNSSLCEIEKVKSYGKKRKTSSICQVV